MPPILPGSRSDYRTTTDAFKWILLIVVLGVVALFYVFKKAVSDADQIYKDAGYSKELLIIKTNQNR